MVKFKTKYHGYNDDEVKSAFQKEIRRGEKERAIYWAFELAYEGKTSFGWSGSHYQHTNYTLLCAKSRLSKAFNPESFCLIVIDDDGHHFLFPGHHGQTAGITDVHICHLINRYL